MGVLMMGDKVGDENKGGDGKNRRKRKGQKQFTSPVMITSTDNGSSALILLPSLGFSSSMPLAEASAPAAPVLLEPEAKPEPPRKATGFL